MRHMRKCFITCRCKWTDVCFDSIVNFLTSTSLCLFFCFPCKPKSVLVCFAFPCLPLGFFVSVGGKWQLGKASDNPTMNVPPHNLFLTIVDAKWFLNWDNKLFLWGSLHLERQICRHSFTGTWHSKQFEGPVSLSSAKAGQTQTEMKHLWSHLHPNQDSSVPCNKWTTENFLGFLNLVSLFFWVENKHHL